MPSEPPASPIVIRVCHGRSCQAKFSPYVALRLRNDHAKSYPDMDVSVETCLCRNRCEEAPVVETADGMLHTRMSPVAASQLLAKLVTEARKNISRPK